jgi:hypothetical protein
MYICCQNEHSFEGYKSINLIMSSIHNNLRYFVIIKWFLCLKWYMCNSVSKMRMRLCRICVGGCVYINNENKCDDDTLMCREGVK